MNSFDILITSFNRAQTLKKCLESFPTQMPENFNEIIILVQNSDSETKELALSFENKFSIKILELPHIVNPGASRNILISAASSEFLCFLDDDIQVSKDYFSICAEILSRNTSDIFGGPDQSLSEFGLKQKVIGELMADKRVMGPTFTRHSTADDSERLADETILTLCNIWFRRNLFDDVNIAFDESIRRCEENKLLSELKAQGHSMFYYPQMVISHFRRESSVAMARIQLLSGFYRSVCFFKTRSSFKPFFLIPLVTGILICCFVFLPFNSYLANTVFCGYFQKRIMLHNHHRHL